MANADSTNWESLAASLNAVGENTQSGSDNLARQAIVALLGEHVLIDAVDHYVHGGSGAELARSVLHLLRPPGAIERCLQIYTNENNIGLRRASVELLRYIGDRRTLPAVKLFFSDDDEDIQNWGASLLDQLVSDRSVTVAEADEFLQAGEEHKNAHVRQIVRWIRESAVNN